MEDPFLGTEVQRSVVGKGEIRTGMRRWRQALLALALAIAAIAALPSLAQAATVSGTVFEDFNDNGARDNSPMIDAGVGGVHVAAYGADGTVLAETDTAADGSYVLTLPDDIGRVRIEFTNLPSGYQPARHGPLSRTTVQFVNVTTGDVSGVDVGILEPSNYCQNNPDLAIACSYFAEANGSHSNDPAIRIVSDSTPDQTTPDDRGPGQPIPGEVTGATFGQVGAIFGTAYLRDLDVLFTSAYAKRHAGWGPGGPGAIYLTDVTQAKAGTPNATVYFDVNSLPSQPAGTATRGTGGWIVDGDAFDIAGNRSLGNLVVDKPGEYLYTVGLATGELIQIPVTDDGSSPDPADVSVFSVPRDACANPDDARPMAVGFHKSGLLYVGGVCSMASQGDPMPQPATDDLAIFIYTFDPATGSFSSSPVLYTPLEADRLCINRGGAFPNENCSTQGAGFTVGHADWHPWTSARDATLGNYYYSQPMLSDIDFDGDDVILAIRDRAGDQAGYDTRRADDSGAERVMAAGYTLRACLVGGSLQLESGGQCGDRAGTGWSATPKYGPGGGLFYWEQTYDLNPPTRTGTHDYGGLGGLLTIPGYPTLRQTHQNSVTVCPEWATNGGYNGCGNGTQGPHTSAGVLYLDHNDGSRDKGFLLFIHNYDEVNSTFGKANGLGDLEAFCDSAPIEIGNFVWVDRDRDGVQDPDEKPLAGVIVELVDKDGNVIATTTTDANGEYYFNESNVPGGIDPETDYTVRIPLDQDALKDYVPTQPNADDPQRDSNGVREGGYVIDRFTTGPAGHNDHTHDFGFYLPFDVSIRKQASAQRVLLGDSLTYTLTVTNNGPGEAIDVKVSDPVPDKLKVQKVTSPKGSCSLAGNAVACELGDLAVGETVKIQVRARATAVGRTVNEAEVVAPEDTNPGNNTDRAPVVVKRGKLALTKTVNRKTVRGGRLVRFTLKVKNTGDFTLRNVKTCDRLPGGFEFVRANPKARFVAGKVCWNLKALKPKQAKRFRITVRALERAAGNKVNRAVATAKGARPARARSAVRVVVDAVKPVRGGGVTG